MEILNKLQELWLYDIELLSKPWMYYTLAFIPYFIFFICKWSVLMYPVTHPLYFMVNRLTSKKDN